MMDEAEATKQVSLEIERAAVQRARDRAKAVMWDIDVAVFMFAILVIVIILLFQGIVIEIVAPVAVFGLAMVWLVGWRRGRQAYQRFYNEELIKLEQESKKKTAERTVEETIDEKVQRALRERWR